MTGLIIKDIINMKKNIKFMSVFTLIYVVMSFTMESSSYFSSMFTLIFAMLTLSSYSLDELAKWDGYALTMPISKENVVQGKYLLMLLLAISSFAINTIVITLMNTILKAEKVTSGVEVGAIGAAIVILFYSISIPIITKFGVEKSRFIIVAIYMLPFLAGTGIFKLLKERYPEPPKTLVRMVTFLMDNIYFIVPAFLLVALSISYLISIRIYQKKEF